VKLLRPVTPYPSGDVRETPTPAEARAAIEAVTGDQVKQFHHDFYEASNSELAVMGRQHVFTMGSPNESGMKPNQRLAV
jgi:hypothetical protein